MTIRKETIVSTVALGLAAVSFITGWATGRVSPPPAEVMSISAADAANAYEALKADAPATISPLTRMVYEYLYEDDGIIETAEEDPPYFLWNKTENELTDALAGWSVMSFEPQMVVLRKQVQGLSGQRYIVGELEGFVAVFYETAINGGLLKEITDTPLAALPEAERQRLKAGIPVVGSEELVKIMQNYGS